jgi:hypothetical protein
MLYESAEEDSLNWSFYLYFDGSPPSVRCKTEPEIPLPLNWQTA